MASQVGAINAVRQWPDMVSRLLGYEAFVLETLHGLGLGVLPGLELGLDEKFDNELIKTIQSSPGAASSLKKELRLLSRGEYYAATVDLEPAANIFLDPLSGSAPTSAKPVVKRSPFKYNYKKQLCSSMKRDEDKHCVNLMVVRLKIGDEQIYHEIRVGIPYAFAVDRSQRDVVTDLRWQEIFVTALIEKHLDKLQAAMRNKAHGPIPLLMFYNCLLSPDGFRRAGFTDKEKHWVNETWERIQTMNAQLYIELEVFDSAATEGSVPYIIKIKPKIFMAVSPCNELAFDKFIPHLGTWHFADFYTELMLKEVLGSLDPKQPVGGYIQEVLDRVPVSAAVKKEVTELCWLLRTLFSEKIHHVLLPEPMYFSNLITELGRMLDAVILIGCKSAKDRTGNKSQSDMKVAFECWLARNYMRKVKFSVLCPCRSAG